MRYLRATMIQPDGELITTVFEEKSLLDPIEEAAEKINDPNHDPICLFVYTEIVEAPDGTDLTALTLQASVRARDHADAEQAMAIGFYWNAEALRRVNPRGVLANPQPAPLSVEEVAYVWRLLVRLRWYGGQTLIGFSSDLRMVKWNPASKSIEVSDIPKGER